MRDKSQWQMTYLIPKYRLNLFLEYSDDSEEVFEKETFDDFDRTVSKYLDELETQSPKLQHTWSPILESPWSSNPKLDLDEFR